MAAINKLFIGNLTADPELRYTQSGTPVVNFTIAETPRVFDKQTNEWKDGDTLFMRATAWRAMAEHISASFFKGSRVIACGELKQRNFEDREGNKRSSIELDVEDIGPSVKYGTTAYTRAQSPQGGQAQGGYAADWAVQPQQGQPAPQQVAPSQGDPWAAAGGQPQQTAHPAPHAQAPQQGVMIGSNAGAWNGPDDTPF